jgi:hypothetical protein
LEKVERLKLKVDILKTKLLFFSAIAGGSWAKISFRLDFLTIVLLVAFLYGVIGALKSLKELNEIKKGLE